MWLPPNTECACPHAGWCCRHGCEKSELQWHSCRMIPALFAAWEAGHGPGQGTVWQRVAQARCRHRRLDPIETVVCDLCGNRGQPMSVFACDIFAECTVYRWGTRTARARNMAACVTCERYESVEMTPGSMPSTKKAEDTPRPVRNP